MKRAILAFVMSVVPNLGVAETEKSDLHLLERYKPYATFFGFSDTKDYLNFANNIEMLVEGSYAIGQSLYEDPDYLALRGVPFSSLSDYQRKQLESIYSLRQIQMASSLGIEEKDLYATMNEYLRYRDLSLSVLASQKALDRNVKALSEDDDEEEEEIEVIEVSAQKLNDMGGYGSVLMRIVLGDMAAQAGVSQYQAFNVVFVSRGTTQKFRYNNYSGAWAVSNEKQAVRPCDTCSLP